MTRLWHRGEPLDAVIERFTVGRDPELDQRLLAYDLLGSAAHATMLAEIGVLPAEQLPALLAELRAMLSEVNQGRLTIDPADEDGHTAIENRLTDRLGELGQRIHTGRSRNDQVIAVLRLWGRELVLEQVAALLELVALLCELAHDHQQTAVAGYSHTRQAMPSTFGLLFGATAEGLLDDLVWLQTAFGHLDRSPLGSASGYGVALPLDRRRVAELLRFGAVQHNTLAVQNDRGKTEALLLGVAAAVLGDLSRLASDLIWFSSEELGYVRLAHEVTTGSSIMPQKRNPDVLELIRGSAARLRARQIEAAGIYGSLSSGYHRDLQLTKEPFVEGMQLCLDALLAMQPVLQTLTVDEARCRGALQPTIGATDAVYRLVQQGQPFRAAYKRVAADPAGAAAGDPAELWRERKHLGAPGALDLASPRERLARGRNWLAAQQQRVAAAWELLES